VAAGVVLGFFFVRPVFASKQLSHSAVEKYIVSQYSVSNVQCNGGKNVPLKAGRTFGCTGPGNASFTVTVKSNSGDYEVQPNG
jgi:hypothetical protein